MLYNLSGYYSLIPQTLHIFPLNLRIGTVEVLYSYKEVRCKFCLITRYIAGCYLKRYLNV